MDYFKKLKRFDAYPKTLEDVRIQTLGGGTLTIFALIIISLLFWIEFVDYLKPNVTEELFVDTSRNPNIKIQIDITISNVACEFLALDAMDASGDQQLHLSHSIFKRSLDLNGTPIQDPIKEEIAVRTKSTNITQGTADQNNKNKTEQCGSCYGAKHGCCNTCDEVRQAYIANKWSLDDIDEIEQCRNENFRKKYNNAFKEGCQIYGHLIVNRVSGSFHIAPGSSYSISHVHIHDVQPFASSEFNMTHRIKRLTFGDDIEPIINNPLKDFQGIVEKESSMFQYYIKIIPTSYVMKNGTVINSNQYSVTKHQKEVSFKTGPGMPGIFFQYELSPLMVKYTERGKSLGHFLTNVCAIVGGVYTVAGLIDKFLYNSIRLIQGKIELGKFH